MFSEVEIATCILVMQHQATNGDVPPRVMLAITEHARREAWRQMALERLHKAADAKKRREEIRLDF